MNLCIADLVIADLVYVKRKIRINKHKFKMVRELIIINHLPEIEKMLEGE